MIPEIARVLKKDGFFITITHSRENMREIVSIIKKILNQNNLIDENQFLPIEIILDQFSAENGETLLRSVFQPDKGN